MSTSSFAPDTRAGSRPDEHGHFGPYGGRFVPEALVAALDELADAYDAAKADPLFAAELDRLLHTYTGRPSPLTLATRFVPRRAGPACCSSART